MMYQMSYKAIYIYESKCELKSNSMKAAEKHNPNRWIYYD